MKQSTAANAECSWGQAGKRRKNQTLTAAYASVVPVVRQRQQGVQALDVADRGAAVTGFVLVTAGVGPAVFFTFADPLPQALDLTLNSGEETKDKTIRSVSTAAVGNTADFFWYFHSSVSNC